MASAVWNSEMWFEIRTMFYAVSPNETSYKTVHEVPDYIKQSIPYFVLFILLEATICKLKGRPMFRVNDAVASISAGVVNLLPNVIFRGVELTTYIWIFDRCSLFKLPWDSPYVWLFCFLVADFLYYWLHRSGHEVNLLWSAHQAHHGSECYNLTTALRQTTFLRYFSWMFYLPLAVIGVPPPIFLVHMNFGILYQFWVHTELVGKLGPLEYIINTPSLHRVHHGKNAYCIDKNYGGTLIIWDLIFGTYESERDDVTIVYGLVYPIKTFDAIEIQIGHFVGLFNRLWKTQGFLNKLYVVVKGPSWVPGNQRLGDRQNLPNHFPGFQPYDPALPLWCSVYIITHFALLVLGYLWLLQIKSMLPQMMVVFGVMYILLTLSSFGWICDHRSMAPLVELIRCVFTGVMYVLFRYKGYTDPYPPLFQATFIFFVFSAVLWANQSFKQYKSDPTSKSDKSL